MAGSQTNQQILKELGAIHPSPSIKNANVPILSGDICVENIHAVYQRTGSSIQDSFSGKGQRTLVISDEAHHIYSPDEAATKKWFDFIIKLVLKNLSRQLGEIMARLKSLDNNNTNGIFWKQRHIETS